MCLNEELFVGPCRHEIVGEVSEVGSRVRKFKVGDKVGVGCMVGSCQSCTNCLENYCTQVILTYGSRYSDGSITYGGYSDIMVVHQHYAVRIPNGVPLDAMAPLLCAGITVYSPLRYYGLDKPGLHLGVISTSPKKKDEALARLGAYSFVVSRDPQEMQEAIATMDGIIDTVSVVHSLEPLLGLLKTNGKLVVIGLPEKPVELPSSLLSGRKMVGGTCYGGMQETQAMIDFAAKNKVTADIELISIDYVNKAMERMSKSDVRYRFVFDIGKTLKPE